MSTLPNITLRQLRYFLALAETRHFGRAAERVGVTQPALSNQIRDLEETLGGPLLSRDAPGLPLTPLGREVALRAQRVITEVRGLEESARQATGTGARVRLGMIPTVAPYLVPPLLAAARRAAAELTIREAVTESLLAELGSGALDAAVIALPAPAGYAVEVIRRDRFLLAMPPGSDAIPPDRPEQIDSARLLLLDEGHCLADQALQACSLRRDGLRDRLGAASLTTLARLVASGQGVTLLPEMCAPVEGRGLRLHRFAEPEPMRTIALVGLSACQDQAWFARLAELLRAASEPEGAEEMPA